MYLNKIKNLDAYRLSCLERKMKGNTFNCQIISLPCSTVSACKIIATKLYIGRKSDRYSYKLFLLQPIHPLILSEEKSVGSIIVRVKATDADDAATVHAEISYVIRAGNEKQKFNLDKSTGKQRGFRFI